MSIRNLQQLFNPGSLAVVGASARPGSVGATTYANVLAGGFRGPVFGVNPGHRTVAGQPSYDSVLDLPQTPELAIVCTPASTVPKVIEQLARCGCRAAVVLSAGLDGDSGDGRSWRQCMLEAARPTLLRILGPNCVGLVVPHIGLNASFAPARALPGRLAFVSQSGAMLTAVLDWANERRIGFSRLVSLGDASDVDFGDMLDFLAGDAQTDAIVLYVESLTHARKFMSAARSAARAKPTIVLKAGRSPKAAKAAFSHTGALAGSDLVYDAALRRAGVLRIFSTEALFDAVAMLSQQRVPRGPRLAIVTNGGGAGVLATDALEGAGGVLAELSAATLASLDAVLPAAWSHGNPVDIVGDAPPQRYLDVLRTLCASGDADAVLLLHAPTAIAASADIASAIVPALCAAPLPILTAWMGGASVAQARRSCAEAGLPVFDTPESAVAGFLQMVQYRQNQQLLMQVPPPCAIAPTGREAARAALAAHLAAGRTQLGMADCAELLKAYGIPVVAGVHVETDGEALAAARAIGYPLALKAVLAGHGHKSDVGGVALDLASDAALLEAMARMRATIPAKTGAPLNGFTIQAMVHRRGAVELIAGLNSDPVFGPVVLFGQGGVAAELVADHAIGLPPLNRVLAAELVGRTRVARLLGAWRNRPAADLDALYDVLERLGQMAADLDQLAELDINPLLADSDGVLALDARMRLAPQAGGLDRLAILPYPAHLAETVQWQGAPLSLRPIRPEDGQAHLEFFSRLAPEDIYFRAFNTHRELTPAQLARLTQIDYGRDMAFIASREGSDGRTETLGVARVSADPDYISGEFAVIVRSDLKGQGLGRLLMERLLRYCRDSGLEELTGSVLSDNPAMVGLAKKLGFAVRADSAGVLALRLVLADR